MISWLALRSAVTSTLARVPRWAWLTLLALPAVWLLRADARSDGYKSGQRDRDDDIRKETDEQIKAAVEAENAITERLNREQLRNVTATDPHNLGRLPYD